MLKTPSGEESHKCETTESVTSVDANDTVLVKSVAQIQAQTAAQTKVMAAQSLPALPHFIGGEGT